MTLDSSHDFLHLYNETDAQTLFLDADKSTEVQTYEDSSLKFSLGNDIEWSVPIKVSFTSCTLAQL